MYWGTGKALNMQQMAHALQHNTNTYNTQTQKKKKKKKKKKIQKDG